MSAQYVSILLLTFGTFQTIAQGRWEFDDAHSNLQFSVTNLMVAEIEGSMKIKEAKWEVSGDDISNGSIYILADVRSIDTDNDARDEHLRTPDFFDAEKFPTLHFKSTSLNKTGNGKYKLTGDLTLHGVTKQVSMDLLYRGTIENAMNKKPTAGFQLTGTINRSDFNIGKGFPAPMISDEVRIKADGEFAQ